LSKGQLCLNDVPCTCFLHHGQIFFYIQHGENFLSKSWQFSTGQETAPTFMEPTRSLYHVLESPSLEFVLNQTNPVHTNISHLLKYCM
jgi:hypothetical protein